MDEAARIRSFLAAFRRRLLLRAGLEAAGWGAAGLGVLVTVLAFVAVGVGPAGFWPTVTATLVAAAALGAVLWGFARPALALRTREAAARRAGAAVPALASDLLSAVQLAEPPDGVSPRLVLAFQSQVADAVAGFEPRRLVPMRPAARAVAAAVIAAAGVGAAGALVPALGHGLRTLVHRPSRFDGAVVSAVPLVGDVRITYSYPPYTGLPPRTVEGSTGDVAAVKGTRVRIETRPLHPASRALILLGEAGEGGELAATLSGGTLSAELTLNVDGSYRFWLEPRFGRAVREQRSHHLTAEPDAPPRVEISGPADRLELPTPRPIEIGYAASDDFGLGAVDLVVRVGERPEQRVPLRDGAGARAVQGRTLWDPATAGLGGAERIAYRIEARDRDAVSGAKVGSSRTLYVIVQNAHESLEDRLDRQRELLEKLIGDLADRLEHGAADTGAAAAGGADAALAERLSAYAAVHEAEESHLALLGQLVDEERRNGSLGKALRATLAGIADRLEKLLREEAQALGALKGRPTTSGGMARLDTLQARHVGELENDVIALDDVIGRQRLEDLASLGKELTDAHQRLQDLLERYKKTKDPALRLELERELRDLRARIADLAQKIAEVRSRNDVSEEWRNLPDMKGLADKARKLDEMLEKGNEADLEKALAQLGDDLRSMRKMLDQNLEGFGAERFPQENRVVADLMKKIGDIEGRRPRGWRTSRRRSCRSGSRGSSTSSSSARRRRWSASVSDSRACRPAIRRVRSPRRWTAPATAPSRCGGCSASTTSPRRRTRPSGRRRAWTGPASTSRSSPRRAAPTGPRTSRSATSAPRRWARRRRWPRRSPTISGRSSRGRPRRCRRKSARPRGRNPSGRAPSASGPTTSPTRRRGASGRCRGWRRRRASCAGPPRACARPPTTCAAINRRPPPPPSATPPIDSPSCATRCRSGPWGPAGSATSRSASRGPTSRARRAPGARSCSTP